MQILSLFCDDILIAKKQNVVKIANERISLKTKKENLKKKLIKQNIRKQNEKSATSIDVI